MKRTVWVGVGFLAMAGCAGETPSPRMPEATARWDQTATHEVEARVEDTFRAIDTGDMDAFERLVAEDGFVTSFDLDMEGRPITYRTKAEAVQTMRGMIGEMRRTGGAVQNRLDQVDCHATATLGVCSVQGEQIATMPDGKTVRTPFRGTGALRKGMEGWQWTTWHASPAQAAPIAQAGTPGAPAAAATATPRFEPGAIDPKALSYMELEGMGAGPEMAPAWTDPQGRMAVTYARLPAKTKIALHDHTFNAWIFVQKGTFAITDRDGRRHEAKAGGMVMQPARRPHVTECTGGCEFIMLTDAPLDMAQVDAQGNVGPYNPMRLVEPPAKK